MVATISSLLHAFGNSLGCLAADGNVSSGRVVLINTHVNTAAFIDVVRAVENAFGVVANVVAFDYSFHFFRFVNLSTPVLRADVGAGRGRRGRARARNRRRRVIAERAHLHLVRGGDAQLRLDRAGRWPRRHRHGARRRLVARARRRRG